jgi:N-acetyl-anhydromuramyl-L-alanine amidase AmpD
MREYAEQHYADFYLQKYGSPHFPGPQIDPKVIVVHYTDGATLENAFRTFGPETLAGRPDLDEAGSVNVGVQFIVDSDGTIYEIQPDNYFGRHCIGLNHSAIGIENVGTGDLENPSGRANSSRLLTVKQVQSNANLIRHLKSKYPAIEILIAHSEYRDLEEPEHPGHELFYEADPDYRTEKSDPGPNFMQALRREISDLLDPDSAGQVFR